MASILRKPSQGAQFKSPTLSTPKGALHRKGKFTLEWLERPELRRQATAELNKAEARNALARAVCFHRLGRLRDRTVEFAE